MLIKLARMVDEEEVEYLIPVMEAKFTVVDEVTGFINWDGEDFDVDLTDERIQSKWNEWVEFKSTNAAKIMATHEVIEYVQRAIEENLKQSQQAHQDEIEAIRSENDKRSEKVRKENDERTETIRSEYQEVQRDLTAKMSEMTDMVSSLANGVKDDMKSINKSAINMSELKNDFAEITGMFKSILDAE